MYQIEQNEPSQQFVRAWRAAGRHLRTVGGEGIKWLRCSLNPPMAEHLSFRMGNQLFFVFVEAAEYDYARRRKLFLQVANEATAIPCRMPMRERLADFEPFHGGSGLVHAETGKPINPLELVSGELIEMSDWELHDFAIQVVRDGLEEAGKNVFGSQSSPHIDPALWFEEAGDACWVVVRAARYPQPGPVMPANIEAIADSCSRMGTAGYFAAVTVANRDDPFDPDAGVNGNFLPLMRGHALAPKFEGLQEVPC
jgi:hypothetical protein